MTPYLILIGLVIILFLIIIALIQRNRAQQQQHYAAIQQTIAQAATAQTEHRQKLDADLDQLHKRQRNETIEETANLSARRDFDNDWSDGLPNHPSGLAAPDSGAPTSSPSGPAVHQIDRTDLSE